MKTFRHVGDEKYVGVDVVTGPERLKNLRRETYQDTLYILWALSVLAVVCAFGGLFLWEYVFASPVVGG